MTRRPDSGLRVSRPDGQENLTWFVDQSMAADTPYPSQDCREFGTIWLEFIMQPDGDPVGDLYIEYSHDGVVWYPFALDTGKWSKIDASLDLTVTESLGKVAVADPDLETRFSLGIEKPPPYLRGRWDFTAGSATGMSGTSFGRG